MSWLSPYRWLLVGALIAAVLAGLWRLDVARQAIGYERARTEYTAAALKAEQAARAKEQSMQSQLQKAQDDAKKRETKLAADTRTLRAERDGLRNDLAASRSQLSSLARDALERYASAASGVFAECSEAYSDMAIEAEQLASDRQTLIDAWPR